MFEYKLEQVDSNDNVLHEYTFHKESRVNNLKYLNVWFKGTLNTENEEEYVSFIIYVYDKGKEIYNAKFELSRVEDNVITSNGDRVILLQCIYEGNYIICDFELLDMPEGIYKANGTFEPIDFDGLHAFNKAKELLNGVRLLYSEMNNFYGLLMDEEGMLKRLPCNVTFHYYFGDVVLIHKDRMC